VRLAARGLRDMDTGTETITDVAELRQIRRQALGVHVKALGTAVLLAILFLVLP
jgi:uncharacterized membrane protein YozB (DUF420 family)